MRTFAGVAISVLCLSATAASPAPAPARGGTKVLCWNKSFPPPTGGGGAQIKRTPKRCTFFKRGESVLALAVQAAELHWKRWGAKRARGAGTVTAAMGSHSPVRVTLSAPRSGCGRRVFSRARFRLPDFDTKTKMRLWTHCD
jgi:hypothetical protein